MLRSCALVATILLWTGVVSAIDPPRPSAPHFFAKTLDGERYDSESVKGRVVLVQFWATWCKYCRRDQDAVDTVTRSYADQGLLVLAVNVGESKKKVREYLQGSPRACKVVLMDDTNLAAIYGATSYPMYVAIDQRGRIAATQNGAAGEESLHDLVRKAGLKAN